MALEDAPRIEVIDRSEWRRWLQENHLSSDGVWLVTYKKSVPGKYLDRGELIEEAICFGWIDSLPRKLDDERTMLWMAPRKPASHWSKLNQERVERMIAAGKMTKAGLDKVEAAKADGSWAALETVEALEIPEDLALEFKKYSDAANHFISFPRSSKRGILEWILAAKRPQTRQKRVQETARLAQDNLRANQWPRKPQGGDGE